MKDGDSRAIGHNLKQILKAKGLTQGQLADGANVSLGQLNRIIKGKNIASNATIDKIINYLDIPREALYGEKTRQTILASKALEGLPDDIVAAIGDITKVDFIRLGIRLSELGLSQEKIEYLLPSSRFYLPSM